MRIQLSIGTICGFALLCSTAAAAQTAAGPASRSSSALIPPSPLQQNLAELKIGLAFPPIKEFDLRINRDQVAGVEQEFCKRDDDLACPSPADRERMVDDLLDRTARIASKSRAGSSENNAALHVHQALLQGRVPILQFNTGIHSGPTAAIVRFQDSRSGKWILGISLAKDFVSSGEDELFLDGVVVQELVHYDDLSYLPEPLRCYESNIEIRGHYAMMRYWSQQSQAGLKAHPRIALAARAGLGAENSRAQWYRYLNQVEKTDFVVEDELVSLEFRSLPTLSSDRTDDIRFLDAVSTIVTSALRRATDVRTHVTRLSSDSINGSARVISAVSRLVPRVLGHYERARAELKDADGTPRVTAMRPRVGDIRRSLQVLNTLISALAADPDFRRKSEFVGPE